MSEPPTLDPARTAGTEEPPGMGRAVAVGAAVGAVLSLIGCTIALWATGTQWESALGLGVFIAFWGGLGFGSMVAGVTWVSHHEQEASGTHPATRHP